MFTFVLIVTIIGHLCIILFLVVDQRMPPKPKNPFAPELPTDAAPAADSKAAAKGGGKAGAPGAASSAGASSSEGAPSSQPPPEAYSDEAIRFSAQAPIKAPTRRPKQRV